MELRELRDGGGIFDVKFRLVAVAHLKRAGLVGLEVEVP